jgi:hypothetical protein
MRKDYARIKKKKKKSKNGAKIPSLGYPSPLYKTTRKHKHIYFISKTK